MAEDTKEKRRAERAAQLTKEYGNNPELLAKKLKDLRRLWYDQDHKDQHG